METSKLFLAVIASILVYFPHAQAQEIKFNLTELMDLKNFKCAFENHRWFFEPCARYTWPVLNFTAEPPPREELHTYYICVFDSTGSWNNMNGEFQLATARKTFIDGVKLTTQQKDVAFNSLDQCVKSKPQIPAEIDVQSDEFANSVRFSGPAGVQRVRQAVLYDLCIGYALIKAGCSK